MRNPLRIGLLLLLVLAAAGGIYAFTRPTSSNAPLTLTILCGVNDADYRLCIELAERYQQQTRIPVAVRQAPSNDATLHLGLLQELTATRSDTVDIFMLDVIWPGLLAAELLDLRPYFNEADLADFFPRILENNTVQGRLVGLPLFSDAGLFYYRRDLLAKYGFSGPPRTWDELEQMAQTIQEGERAEGSSDFWGYVWHGAQNEGLTCTALELLVSHGGGTIVQPDGTVNIANPRALQALARAAGWIGSISPPETVTMGGGGVRTMLANGQAAFARDWPVGYNQANAETSPVRGQVGIAVLPVADGSPAATLGGWQLAINRHSRQPQAAADFLRYLAGPEAQKVRAISAGFIPTRQSLYQDAEVLAANPFFETIPAILAAAVARPSSVTAGSYNEVSTAFSTAVNRVLRRSTSPEAALAELQTTLEAFRGQGW